MPERENGYQTIDLFIDELAAPMYMISQGIKTLKLQTMRFPGDTLHQYFSRADVDLLKEWILEHKDNLRSQLATRANRKRMKAARRYSPAK